ncbi:restriction endonuclease subunit S [Tenuifilaceae bacterium CYCD]|nr:restriction endonuclease subunit S [Tenuifilaceae bacterium CYCD]
MKDDNKDSSFGLIPSNWEVAKLGDIFESIGNFSYTRADLKNELDEGCVFYIHYGDIHATYSQIILDFSKEKNIPVLKEDIVLPAAVEYLKNGDLVIADASEDYEGIGKCIELTNIGNKKVIGGLHTIILRDKCRKTFDGYRGYLLRNNIVSKELRRIATGTSVYGITKSNLSRVNLLLPPLPEQKKIADILTTVDDKLENIESQIAEYTNLKTGLMQLLLTKGIGHTKFVDSELGMIPEGWKVVKLGDIGEFSKGKGISKSDVVSNGIPCIRYGEIYTVHHYVVKKFYSYITKEVAANSKLLNKNDILFAGSGETVEDIGKAIAYIGDEEAYAGGDTIIFSPKEDDSVFLSYCLNDKTVTSQRVKFGQGNSVVHIYSKDLCKLFVPKPPIKEQQKISNILNAVDDKIESLQQKKEEFTNLKKGLMEQLLTGRIRVKV